MKRISLLGLAIVALAGCGADDEKGKPIPAAQAAELQKQLDSVEQRFQAGGGACNDISGGNDPNQPVVERTIGSLPDDVDPDVRQALEDSFDRLFQLTSEQCDEQKGEQTQTETTPQPKTETQTQTETAPTQTETTPKTQTETTPTETQPEPTTPTETTPGGNGGAGAPGGGG